MFPLRLDFRQGDVRKCFFEITVPGGMNFVPECAPRKFDVLVSSEKLGRFADFLVSSSGV